MISLCDAGIVCEADSVYNFDYIDLYSPPKPNLKIIKDAIFEITENYNYYKNKINVKNAQMSETAKQYVNFANMIKNM